ncbi:unnamed protein product [Miscanthus lutarioriparius]|uniref:NB-ARC domain-containing protein n=1 Tax=Miscanthus lutarioriparius TaxID=422564 RepID=A0A811MZ51_9POAL|nr:unnamed protein product [Miscanthus lutarioriparius]
MAGLIASGIVKWTASKLSSLVSAPVWTAPSDSDEGQSALEDLRELRRSMIMIQRTLDESAEGSIRGEAERLRLSELQQFVYDAQDAVDQYKYELLRRRIEDQDRQGDGSNRSSRKRKGQKKEPEVDPIPVPVPDELATRVKKISERFNEITRAWNDLQMDESDAPMLEDDNELLPLPTNPHVDELNIVGREEDKESVIKMLTAVVNADAGTLSVLPVIGMGGVGKTTPAQLVYNDRRISKYFDIKGWVHVSPEFRVKNLASKILMSFSRRQCEAMEMDDLQDALTEQVEGMKFLLVLDDEWNEDRDLWNTLLSPMLSAQLGMILLTTLSSNCREPQKFQAVTLGMKTGRFEIGCRVHPIDLALVTSIPDSMENLHNLKVLDSRTYSLTEIPQGIKKLVSLRHLQLEKRSPLCMPSGVGQLKKLQSLSRFSIGSGSWHCNIAELHGFVNIRPELSITGLRRVGSVDDAQTANLVSKQHLLKLTLDWADGSLPSRCRHHSGVQCDLVRTPEFEEAIFESLRPHSNLKELEVANYGGYRYPEWLGLSRFTQLTRITLYEQSSEFLPTLVKLPQLLEISVQWMRGVRHISKEFCGQGDIKGFPSLKDLEFENMPNLGGMGKLNEGLFSDLDLPLLQALKVSLSHNIEYVVLSQNLPLLELLVVRACHKLQELVGLSNLQSLKLLNIIACRKLHLPFDQPLPQQLERLTILKCPQLHDWLEFQNVQLYNQLLSDHESDEDREALEMLWDETDDEVEEEFLDIPENDDDAESDFGPSGFSIDDDDQED